MDSQSLNDINTVSFRLDLLTRAYPAKPANQMAVYTDSCWLAESNCETAANWLSGQNSWYNLRDGRIF